MKAYVLLSGGIDSSTCLAYAIDKFGADEVCAVSVHYGQRHTRELQFAEKQCSDYGVKHDVVNIAGVIGIGGLTDADLDIPPVSYDELPHGVSPTYVPFRNGLLLSILTSRAAADPDAKEVIYGAHAEDAENDAYPDCSVEFIGAIGEAIRIGTYGNITLNALLARMTKDEVVTLGDKLGVPWHNTWSCYEGREIHCGVCPTCRARKQAFKLAGVYDPTVYADEEEVA